MQKENAIKQKTNKQNLLIILCWLVYTISYMGRNSYSSNITRIEDFFSIKHADSGLVSTFFFIAYGVGQVVNGFLCKKYPKKYIFPIVLFCGAFINLLVFIGIPFTFYKYLWLVNGFVQSALWSTLVLTLGEYLHKENMARAIFFMGISAPVGTLFAYGTSSLFSLFANFKLSFIVACVSMSAVAILWLIFFNRSTKFGVVEKETVEEEKKTSTNTMVVASLGLLLVFLAIFAVVVNLLKDGLQTWVPTILKEKFSLSDALSIFMSLALPILGAFGATLALFLNKIFKDYILLAGVLFLVSLICLGGVILLFQTTAWVAVLIAFACIVCFMFGVNNIITSMVPIYLRDRVNSGKVAGVLNGFAYVGSAISSFALGSLADSNGWNSVFILLFALNAAMVLLTFVYVIFTKLKGKNKKQTFDGEIE